MNKVWEIIKYEYRRHVFRKRFLFSLLSLPLVVVIMVAVGLLIAFVSMDTTPVGYIDRAGFLENPVPIERKGSLFKPVMEFRAYADEDQAKADLDEGEIQAYYIIPATYPASPDVELVYFEMPDPAIQNQFNEFMRNNLQTFESLSPQVKTRLSEGEHITLISIDGSREMQQNQWYLTFIPYIAGIMFVVVVMTSAGYLLQAVVEEKENRTMEIVITSVSPNQLMTGKIIGNIAVGLTQLVAWLLFSWAAIKIGGQFFPFLQDFSLSPDFVLVLFLTLIPSFIMIAAIMAAIGATVTEMKEAQQVSGLFSIPMTIPYYFSWLIMMNPNGVLAIVLSYFPLTAPITLLMRMAFTVIPPWQIALNIAILVVFAILSIWLAGRTFRMGMLRYGQKLSLKEILGKQV